MLKIFNVINEMNLRYYHLPSEQAESVQLINNNLIESGDFTPVETMLLQRINYAIYKLVKGDR